MNDPNIEIVWPTDQDAMIINASFSGFELRESASTENRLYMLLRTRLMAAIHLAEEAVRVRNSK